MRPDSVALHARAGYTIRSGPRQDHRQAPACAHRVHPALLETDFPGIAPGLLEIEFTESALVRNPSRVHEQLLKPSILRARTGHDV
jgi:hypothetical protein